MKVAVTPTRAASVRGTRWLVEGIVHFQQQGMVALDNQGIMGLKAGGVVHAPAFELAAVGISYIDMWPGGPYRARPQRGVYQKERLASPQGGIEALVGFQGCSIYRSLVG